MEALCTQEGGAKIFIKNATGRPSAKGTRFSSLKTKILDAKPKKPDFRPAFKVGEVVFLCLVKKPTLGPTSDGERSVSRGLILFNLGQHYVDRRT